MSVVVVKLVTFATRKTGVAVEAFQEERRTKHAKAVLRLPGLRGYVQSHVLPSGYRKREPFCDVLDELWFDDRTALEQAREAFAEVDGALVTTEHLIKDGRQQGPGVKNIELVVRRRDLAVEEFHRYWREHHGPLAARIAPIRRYVQSHSIDDPAVRAYDGIASTWFDDIEAMRVSATTDAYRLTREDEENFVTPPLSFVIAREHVYLAPPPVGRIILDAQVKSSFTSAMRDYQLISADSHVVEPPDLWEKWLEKKYHGTAPKLVDDGDGGDAWLYLGRPDPEPLGLVTCVGTRPEELKWTGAKYGVNIHPACHDGKARLEILDTDGIDAEMLYPPQRAMLTFMKQTDKDAHLAGIRAYNRWLKEGFCAADPERLIGIFQMPNVGIETSVAELKRAKKEGWRGVAISAWPAGGESLSREDDPFWDVAAELDMPVSIHLLLAVSQTKIGVTRAAGVAIGAAAFANTMPLITELIFQGVFDRFPKLRMGAIETGVGWIPHFLEMTDDRYWRNRVWAGVKIKKVPSQYFRDHWLATFIVDRNGISVRHQVGIENMAWSTDFPHHGNDYPYSRKTIDDIFAQVSADERRKITCTNAAKFWGLSS